MRTPILSYFGNHLFAIDVRPLINRTDNDHNSKGQTVVVNV
jgi:hypothetical protein